MNTVPSITRRKFVATSAMALAATRVLGANDRIHAGVIGAGQRARSLMRGARQLSDVSMDAVCDLYQGNRKSLELAAPGATFVGDYRRILERKDIDAVIVATHNHWHHQVAIDALSAGKDLYLEKPMTHKLPEGRQILDAAERHGRIVQVGHHRRSAPVYQKARELVQSGALGKTTFVRVAWFRNTEEPQWRRAVPADASPQTIDWKTFIAKTNPHPFDAARFFQWFCYWDYCGGIGSDLLVHSMDAVHMIMGAAQPARVVADGEILYWKDGRDVPDTMSAIFQYPAGYQVNFSCTFANQQPGTRDGFYGKDGTVEIVNENTLHFYPEKLAKNPKPELTVTNAELSAQNPTELHVKNFFESMRSRKPAHCTAQDGENSAVCTHLANMAMREQRVIRWDSQRYKVS